MRIQNYFYLIIFISIVWINNYYFETLKLNEGESNIFLYSGLLKIYPGNNFYVTNNNMALYSSYIIKDENNYTIEAIAEYTKYKSDLKVI
jgi:hypothetical protein